MTYLAKQAACVGNAIGLSPSHGDRVAAELAAWVRDPKDSSWACEAGGLRLRAGGVVPGYMTADLYGSRFAVRGLGAPARARLLDAIATRSRDLSRVPWSQRWMGLRPETRCEAWTLIQCQTTSFHSSVCVRSFEELGRVRARATEKWYLPRTFCTMLTLRAWLHWVSGNAFDLYEAGSGPVSLGVGHDEAVVVVVPEPGCASSQVELEIVAAHAAAVKLRRTHQRWRAVVAEFDLLPDVDVECAKTTVAV